ncbi:MAG: T9SS type A sorting domain-containing protein [Ignavibacteriae bacterium]|nr:T9SS type A sorting domain-containing protein [Ignavibacteriota bacterium]
MKFIYRRRKTELGNYAKQNIEHKLIPITFQDYLVEVLKQIGKREDSKILRQIFSFQKERKKEQWKKFLSEKQTFAPWMLVLDSVNRSTVISDTFISKILNSFISNFTSNIFRFAFSFFTLFFANKAFSQSVPVTGRVVDETTQTPLSNVTVEVHTSYNNSDQRVETGITDNNGRFSINASLTDIKNEKIIYDNYSISEAYPNPTSGISNVEFGVPKQSNITLKVFNVLGEECFSDAFDVSRGVWRSGFDLRNYAAGFYVVGLFSEGRRVKTSKLVVDKHVSSGELFSLSRVSDYSSLGKSSDGSRFIDSLVFSFPDYRCLVLRDVGFLDGHLDVSDVFLHKVLRDVPVFVYDLLRWREKELYGVANAMVRIGKDSVLTDLSGRAIMQLKESDIPYDVRITSPLMRQRDTKIKILDDRLQEFDVLTYDSYPDSIYNFMVKNFGVNEGISGLPFRSAKWGVVPEFVFATDTTLSPPNSQVESWSQLIDYNLFKIDSVMVPASQILKFPDGSLKGYSWNIDRDVLFYDPVSGVYNNGKYIIYWDDSVRINYGGLAFTGTYLDYSTGEILAAETMYDSFKDASPTYPVWRNIDSGTLHELDTGIYKTGRMTDIRSVSNRGPPFSTRNYTSNDYPIRLYLNQRPMGTVAPDRDDGGFGGSLSKSNPNIVACYSFTMLDGSTRYFEKRISGFEKIVPLNKIPQKELSDMIKNSKVNK